MEDADLLKKAELVHDKLLGTRAALFDQGGSEPASPLHPIWHDACVYIREAGAVHDELKRRFNN